MKGKYTSAKLPRRPQSAVPVPQLAARMTDGYARPHHHPYSKQNQPLLRSPSPDFFALHKERDALVAKLADTTRQLDRTLADVRELQDTHRVELERVRGANEGVIEGLKREVGVLRRAKEGLERELEGVRREMDGVEEELCKVQLQKRMGEEVVEGLRRELDMSKGVKRTEAESRAASEGSWELEWMSNGCSSASPTLACEDTRNVEPANGQGADVQLRNKLEQLTDSLTTLSKAKRKADDMLVEERAAKRRAWDDYERERKRREDAEDDLKDERDEADRLWDKLQHCKDDLEREKKRRIKAEDAADDLQDENIALRKKLKAAEERLDKCQVEKERLEEREKAFECVLREERKGKVQAEETLGRMRQVMLAVRSLADENLPSLPAGDVDVPSGPDEGSALDSQAQ
ncbi:hypothetical protein FRB99_001660 [Tulasnella sp. 403]|nr:hypothetical protein FRB99_001660 [Tulasnella sp. 403]